MSAGKLSTLACCQAKLVMRISLLTFTALDSLGNCLLDLVVSVLFSLIGNTILYDFARCTGLDEERKDFATVSLLLAEIKDGQKTVRCKASVCMIDKLGAEKHIDTDDKIREFTKEQDTLRWKKFIRREYLMDETNGLLFDDSITIQVKLTVLGERKSICHDGKDEHWCLQKLSQSFADLLHSGLHTDVTLFVGGQEIPAHKTILAIRSPVFKAMFANKMTESLEGVVHIDDIELPVFQQLLRSLLVCLY